MSKWLLIFGFLGSLLVLTYGTFLREQPEFEEDRLRHPFAPFPTKRYEFEDYPRWTELALVDRFGYRDLLLRSNRQIHQQFFGESDSVFAWTGKDDWLFINVGDPNRGHDDKPSLDARLNEWAVVYTERSQWCRANGMEYVLLLAPEKSSVYPEYLTEQQRRQLPEVEVNPRLKQMLNDRGVRVVEPLEALLEAKKDAVIYHQNDTHWNQTGAYIAHRALMKELNVVPSAGYKMETKEYTGDLNRLTGTTKTCQAPYYTLPTHTPVWNLDHPSRELLPPEARPKHLPAKVSIHPKANGPAIVFFHDSFGEAMFDFLSHDCQYVATAATDHFEKDYVLAHKPALVVQEIVSRKLYRFAPNLPPAFPPAR